MLVDLKLSIKKNRGKDTQCLLTYQFLILCTNKEPSHHRHHKPLSVTSRTYCKIYNFLVKVLSLGDQ